MRHRITLKTPEQIGRMRAAGLVVAQTLEAVTHAVAPGVSTAELDAVAAATIRAAGAEPSFLGYQGYPATICTSVNDRIVHGIPSPTQILQEGDIISIDAGAIVDGWHGDSAVTVPVGEVSAERVELIRVCEAALWAGLAAAVPGARLTDISHAVESCVRSAGGYGIIEEYVGHGIGTQMHEEPPVPNYGRPGRGPRLVPGMVLAVEPMITLASAETVLLDDGWTVITRDGSPAAHTEHTVAVTEDGPVVLTAVDAGVGRLGPSAGFRSTPS